MLQERCNRWRGLLDFAAMSARLVQAWPIRVGARETFGSQRTQESVPLILVGQGICSTCQAIFNELHTNWRLQPEEEVEQEVMPPQCDIGSCRELLRSASISQRN
eukprot:125158-Amphidinium_carterae.1